jgi:hypothetical protein
METKDFQERCEFSSFYLVVCVAGMKSGLGAYDNRKVSLAPHVVSIDKRNVCEWSRVPNVLCAHGQAPPPLQSMANKGQQRGDNHVQLSTLGVSKANLV